MNDVKVDKVMMVCELVNLLIEKGFMKDPSEKNKKMAQYLGDSEAALRDLLKFVQAAEVAKKPDEPDMGGWTGTYEFKQPADQKMIYGFGAPFRVLMAGPATVKASVSHAETGAKLEMSGDAKALRWLFTEGPFSFLAEAGDE